MKPRFLPRGPIALATLRTTCVFGLRLVAQAGVLLLLTYLLGPEGFSAFSGLAALAVLLGSLATFGSHLTLLRDLSRDPDLRDASLAVSLGTTVVCGTVLLGVFLLLAQTLFASAGVPFFVLICLGVVELLLQPLLVISAMQRQADNQIARSQLIITLPLLLRLFFTAAVWLSACTHPLEAYAVGHCAAAALALGFSLRALRFPWPQLRRWKLLDGAGWRDNSGFAFLAMSAVAPNELDKMLALSLLPLGMAGVYAAASRVVGALILPVMAMMVAALPRLFRQSGVGKIGRKMLLALFSAASLYGLMAGLLIWWITPFLEWLFGSGYTGIAETLRSLAFVLPGMCLRLSACSLLMTMNHPWLRIGAELGGCALLVIFAWWLAPESGLQGLVLAVAVAEWGMAIVIWAWIGKSHLVRA